MAWTVLLVDDSRTIQEIVRMTLRVTPFSLVTASSLTEGLDAARRAHPDVVLADVRLPDGDGYELCRQLKEDPELAAIPVLLFIGVSQTPDVAQSKEVRAMGFFPKPFSSQDLIDQLTLLSEARSRKTEQAEPVSPGLETMPVSDAAPVVMDGDAFSFDAQPTPAPVESEEGGDPFASLDGFSLSDEAAPKAAFDEPEEPPAPLDDFALDGEPVAEAALIEEEVEPLLEIEPFERSEPAEDSEWRLDDDSDLIRTDEVLSTSRFDAESDPMGMLDDSEEEPARGWEIGAEEPVRPKLVTQEEASFLLEEIVEDDEQEEAAAGAQAVQVAEVAEQMEPEPDLELVDDLEPVEDVGFADELEPLDELSLEPAREPVAPAEPDEAAPLEFDLADDLEPVEDLGLVDDLEPIETEALAIDEGLDEEPLDDLDGDLSIEILDEDLGAAPPPEDLDDRMVLDSLRRQRLTDFDTPFPAAEDRDVSQRPADVRADALPDDEGIDLVRTVPRVVGEFDEDQPILSGEAITTEIEPEIDASPSASPDSEPLEELSFDLAEEALDDDDDVEVELYEIPPEGEPPDRQPQADEAPSGDDIVALFRRAVREELSSLQLPDTRLAPGTREAIRDIVRDELSRALGDSSRPVAPLGEPSQDDMPPVEPMDQGELLTAVRQAVRHEVTETLESVVVEAVESMTRKVVDAASAPIGPAEMEDLVGRISVREMAVALEAFPKPITPPSAREIAEALDARIMGPLDEIRKTLSTLPRYERMGEEIHTWIHSALGELPTADEIRSMLAGLGTAAAPSVAPTDTQADSLRAMLREELAGLVGQQLEAVAWEVVPDLAEQIIKKELDRLTS